MPAGTYSTIVTYTAIAEGVPEEHTMQEFTVAECANKADDENFYLIDDRDKKIYKMVKARDGNCYMAENLKYKNVESSNWSDNNYTEPRLHISTNEGYEGEYYYNYPSAISVCPVGWSLPSGPDSSENGSLAHLMSTYNITTSSQLLAQTSLGYNKYYGYWEFSLAKEYNQGKQGSFWTSSTPTTADRAYTMVYYYNGGGVGFPGNPYRAGGNSVRCVYQPRMQDLTMEECNKLDLEKSVLLTDSRDNKQYKVARLKDGNCWMQQNLALDGGRTLTPTNSNVSSDVTLPANVVNNTTSVYTAMQIVSQLSGYDGNYYNWCAATVSGDCSKATTEQTNSVCPKGWRLPSNSGNPSFNHLFSLYNLQTTYDKIEEYGNAVSSFPLYYSKAGIYISRYQLQGTDGYYWTRTPAGNIYVAYMFLFTPVEFKIQVGSVTKDRATSVRCLALGA